MIADRKPCCLEPNSPCGTRWEALRSWACFTTGKGVRLVTLEGQEQGKPPFFSQPVGFDGKTFFLAHDHGCDTEKLLHEVCHWLAAPRERRSRMNYGLGPGATVVEDAASDNEEVTAMLLEGLLAPRFRLAAGRIAKPDYNVADRRNVRWEPCQARAEALLAQLSPGLPAADKGFAGLPGKSHRSTLAGVGTIDPKLHRRRADR